MRPIIRRAGKTLGVVAVGYGTYTAAVQYRAGLEIARRKREEPDLERRFAPIRILGRYVNPFEEYRHQTLFEFGFRRISELFALHPAGDVPVDREVLRRALPIYEPDFQAQIHASWVPNWAPEFVQKYASSSKMALTWFGQSCALAQLPGNVNILTDPMFADYVVSKNVGPQRLVPAPVSALEIPQPNVILVSHDHQDHLDLAAAAELTRKGTMWIVPQGVGKHLPSEAKFVEMTWWDRIPLPQVDPKEGYEVACTPAMHWSGRALYDSNTTLWCSFLILRHGKPVFFHGGDTGYTPDMFKAIAKVYGDRCSVAMVPCGAYIPRWHLRAQHMAPHESLETMRDLGAKNMVGVHWGTFVMSEEPFSEPPKKLLELARNGGFENVVAPSVGKTMVFDI